MDSLDDLPVAKTVLSPKEEASLQRLFRGESSPPPPPSGTSSLNFRLALASLVGVFVLLANPWTTGVVETLPKCQGNVAQLLVKTLVFLIVAFVVLRWVL